MLDFTEVCTARGLPKVLALQTCELPFVTRTLKLVEGGEKKDYTVLELPQELRRLFDDEGASVVRINSLAFAQTIPDFGGKASGENFSLPIHQDHFDASVDMRRFLMLSKLTDGARGASTLVMTLRAAALMLLAEEDWVKDSGKRALIGAERCYDQRFLISEAQYDSCFDEEGGYERVVAMATGEGVSAEREIALRLGILDYLIRGSCADELMREIVQTGRGTFFEERWESGGSVIIDNRHVFHARFGGNHPPLKRNYCIEVL